MTRDLHVYQLAGATLLELNEYERARHDLEAALLLNPKLPGIYTMVGEAEIKLVQHQISPDDFEANFYVSGILYKRRDLDKAKPYLEKALKLKPKDTMAR